MTGSRPIRALSVLGSFALLACGGDGGDRTGQDGGSGVVTVSGGATGDTGVGDGDSGGDKFDVGGTGSGTCDGQGGGGGMSMDGFSFIWIANTNEGTVSKINTETGVEEGRYITSATQGDSPSRTTVNQLGDVLVGNRGPVGGVMKVAAVETRCEDRNMDGTIQTSTGPTDILPFMQDECVLWYVDIPSLDHGHGPRGLAWEGTVFDMNNCTFPEPRVWVSWHGSNNDTQEAWRLDGVTGQILDQVSVPDGSGGRTYGGAVNQEGDLWISTRGSPARLIRIDAETLAYELFDVPQNSYGVAVDANGDPWVAPYGAGAGDQVYRFDVATSTFVPAGGGQGRHRGIQLDRQGFAWAAGNSPCRLVKFDGNTDTLVDDNIPLPGCSDPVGTSIDRDGYVWVVDRGAGKAWKIDPMTHAVVFEVLGLLGPYTYSDMTGSGLDLVFDPPQG